MRKIFFATLLAIFFAAQNFCSAAEISAAKFNGNENLIYPVVQTGNAAVDKRINVAIIAELDRFVTGVYRNAQENNFTVADIRTRYEVGSNQAGNTVILSLLITESNYFKDAAHPSTVKHALNFNTSSGELIGLDYLTDVGSGVSVDEILKRVERALIQKCQRENLYLFDEALPLKSLPENFYWDENLHVHFIFQHYDVAPYAAGIIDVDIEN